MKTDRNMLRLAVVQHLRDYGIKVKHWNRMNCNSRPLGRDKKISYDGVFGTPLHALPQCTLLEHASIPQFLVDACSYLEKHIHTEGLFRKSGSVSRLKVLKAKVDQGEKCLTLAPPCDVAGLVKQFFRELPEPVLPVELHEAFFRAQQLQDEERISATILLSCLLPEQTVDILHYFLNFLKNVSLRSKDNKMDASNLAVVFAPNLFHSVDGSEKVTLLVEKRLHLQAATVHILIDHFEGIGCVPEFILEKIPAMLGDGVASIVPSLENLEDGVCSRMEECKRRRRRSVGDIVSGALSKLKSNRTPSTTPHADTSETSSGTPTIKTPTWKRKLLVDSSQSLGFSNKKRRSLRHNIALELLPSGFLSQHCTPSSVGIKKNDDSPHVSLESLQDRLYLSTGSPTVQTTASTNRRKSKRLENKRVERLESGKVCCFSPKFNRKEMVRKSLRIRFSLGKSKDANTLPGIPVPNGSENIGWRLANQSDGYRYNWFSTDHLPLSPDGRGWKRRSKSEENLLTPVCNQSANQMSWNGASPIESQVKCDHVEMRTTFENDVNSRSCQSEPALVIRKPPTIPGELQNKQNMAQKNSSKKCSESSKDDQAGETVLNIKKAFSESEPNLCSLIGSHICSTGNDLCENNLLSQQILSTSNLQKADKPLKGLSDQKWPPFELPSQPISSLDHQKKNGVAVLQNKSMSILSLVEDPTTSDKKCVTLLSLQGLPSPEQMSNHKEQKDQDENSIPIEKLTVPPSSGTEDSHHSFELYSSVFSGNELGPNLIKRDNGSISTDGSSVLEFPAKMPTLDIPLKISAEVGSDTECGRHLKVGEHIQRFNSLSLNDQTPKYKTVLSPLRFKRTPVRQSVRRMNALLSSGDKLVTNRTRSCKSAIGSPHVKLLSHGSGLSLNPNSLALKQNLSIKQSKHANSAHQNNLSTEGFCKTKLAIHTKHSTAFKEKNLGSQQKDFDQKLNQPVFEDWTNRKVSRINLADCVLPKHDVITEASKTTPEKSFPNAVPHKVSEKEKNQYKGSPKCPISTKLTTKAIDL